MIQFADVERPVISRPSTAAPNPFTEVAVLLAGDRTLTKGFTIALPTKAEGQHKDGKARNLDATQAAVIDAVSRQLSKAGTAAGVTIKKTVERTGTKAEPSATFTVWAVDKYASRAADAADKAE